MENILVKLKAILNGLSDEELKEYDLWIDNDTGVEVIAVDNNSISLITESSVLEINGKIWWIFKKDTKCIKNIKLILKMCKKYNKLMPKTWKQRRSTNVDISITYINNY